MKISFLNKKYLYVLILGILSFLIYDNCEFHGGEIRFFSNVYQLKSSSIPQNEIQTFVINLDRSHERYSELLPQLDKNHLNYERFSAVDGYKVQVKNNKTGETFLGSDIKKNLISDKFSYTVSCPSFDSNYSPLKKEVLRLGAGAMGCYCSHMEIWNKMILDGVKYTLVLEDDAFLLPRFEERFDKIINNLPQEWDIVFLHLNILPSKLLNIKDNRYVQKIKRGGGHNFTSTTAYLINADAAKKIFEFSKNYSFSVDVMISKAVDKLRLNAYKTTDNIIMPSGDGSIIAEMGRDLD
jgi:glycosyl transferase family 25